MTFFFNSVQYLSPQAGIRPPNNSSEWESNFISLCKVGYAANCVRRLTTPAVSPRRRRFCLEMRTASPLTALSSEQI